VIRGNNNNMPQQKDQVYEREHKDNSNTGMNSKPLVEGTAQKERGRVQRVE